MQLCLTVRALILSYIKLFESWVLCIYLSFFYRKDKYIYKIFVLHEIQRTLLRSIRLIHFLYCHCHMLFGYCGFLSNYKVSLLVRLMICYVSFFKSKPGRPAPVPNCGIVFEKSRKTFSKSTYYSTWLTVSVTTQSHPARKYILGKNCMLNTNPVVIYFFFYISNPTVK